MCLYSIKYEKKFQWKKSNPTFNCKCFNSQPCFNVFHLKFESYFRTYAKYKSYKNTVVQWLALWSHSEEPWIEPRLGPSCLEFTCWVFSFFLVNGFFFLFRKYNTLKIHTNGQFILTQSWLQLFVGSLRLVCGWIQVELSFKNIFIHVSCVFTSFCMLSLFKQDRGQIHDDCKTGPVSKVPLHVSVGE